MTRVYTLPNIARLWIFAFLTGLACLGALFNLHGAHAAVISLIEPDPNATPRKGFNEFDQIVMKGNDLWMRLDGDIKKGDFKKFDALVRRGSRKLSSPEYPEIRLVLNSDGGSFAEALKIAKTHPATTIVKSGERCLSACAIIFMSGRMYNPDGDILFNRYLHARGKVGFHAPYPVIPQGEYSQQTVANVHRVAQMTARELLKLKRDFSLNDQFLDVMLERGKDELHYIETVEDAIRFRVSIFGLPSDIRINKANATTLCMNGYELHRISGRSSANKRDYPIKANDWKHYHGSVMNLSSARATREKYTYKSELDQMLEDRCEISVDHKNRRITWVHVNIEDIHKKSHHVAYGLYSNGLGAPIWMFFNPWTKLRTLAR